MAREDLIQVRRDTAANWASVNPVLESGEPGFDLTNDIFKIGDGTTAWADLPSIAGGGGGGSVAWVDVTGKPDFGTASLADTGDFASAAEGDLAATALQPDDGLAALDAGAAAYLAGIEAGAQVNDTAAEILTKLLTVDGGGSGLDADLLDGQSSANFATAAQGALADTAVQPADLGTAAAADTGDFATAAQGALADTAVQPAAIADFVTGGSGSAGVAAVTNVVAITQADHTALSPADPNTLYFIVGA